MIFERAYQSLILTTDLRKFDLTTIHSYLKNSYWTPGISYSDVIIKVKNSLAFALLKDEQLIGFARVISDQVSFAYLADVFILDEEQGHGYGTWMIQMIMEHPYVSKVKTFLLATDDAHELYKKFDFTMLDNSNNLYMIRRKKST